MKLFIKIENILELFGDVIKVWQGLLEVWVGRLFPPRFRHFSGVELFDVFLQSGFHFKNLVAVKALEGIRRLAARKKIVAATKWLVLVLRSFFRKSVVELPFPASLQTIEVEVAIWSWGYKTFLSPSPTPMDDKLECPSLSIFFSWQIELFRSTLKTRPHFKVRL